MRFSPRSELPNDRAIPTTRILPVWVALLLVLSSPSIAAFGDVLHTIPCAGSNTSDLAWVNGTVYQVIFSPTEQRAIYKLSPSDGQVLAVIPHVGSSPQGLTYDGHNLWQGDLGADMVYKLDPETGAIRGQFAAPGGAEGQPLGLGWDGTNLWIADSRGPEKIWQVDTVGVVIGQIPAPGASPYGMEHAAGYLWVSDNNTTGAATIYRLDPATGAVLDQCPCPGSGGSPNGITHDGENLWIAVNSTDLIYEVDDGLAGGAAPPWIPARTVLPIRIDWVRSGSAGVEAAFTLAVPGDVVFSLLNAEGRRCGTARGMWPAGTHQLRLDAEGLSSGVYFVRAGMMKASCARKFVFLRR